MTKSKTVVHACFGLAALLFGIPFTTAGQTTAASSTLDLSPEQRQALLHDQIREHQKLLNERQRAFFERQRALQSQLQAQRELELAKKQAVWDQYQSGLRRSEAVNAITAASARTESERIEAENVRSRTAMVERVVQDWKLPRGYEQIAGDHVTLRNPFEPESSETDHSSSDLADAVRGTILELDLERSLARIGGSIPTGTCGASLLAGDYPVLADGNLLDTPDRVTSFLEACADPTAALFVLRNDIDLLLIERSF